MTDEWMRHPVTGLTAPHHATQTAAQAQEAPVNVQDTQKAREERWARIVARTYHDFGVSDWPRETATRLMALADREVLAAITVARQDVAQCVAERDEARAEVERLREDIDQCWVPLYHGARADGRAAETREVALRERIEALADWFESQPNWVEWGVHRQIRAALAAEHTPPAAPHAEDGA